MKKEKVVSEETIANTAAETETVAPAEEKSKKVKQPKDKKELHDIFFMWALIAGVVGFIFVYLAQNAVNNDDNGFVSLGYRWFKTVVDKKTGESSLEFAKQYFDIPFLTTTVCSLVAGVFGLGSVGLGIGRNMLKHDKKVTSYILGVIVIVLAIIAFLAGHYANA